MITDRLEPMLSILVQAHYSLEPLIRELENLDASFPTGRIEILFGVPHGFGHSSCNQCNSTSSGIKIRIFAFNSSVSIGERYADLSARARGQYCTILAPYQLLNPAWLSLLSHVFSSTAKLPMLLIGPGPGLFLRDSFPNARIASDNINELGLYPLFICVWMHHFSRLSPFNHRLNISAEYDFASRLLGLLGSRAKIIHNEITNTCHHGSLLPFAPCIPIPLTHPPGLENIRSCDPDLYLHGRTFFFCLTHSDPLYRLPGVVNIINVSSEPLGSQINASSYLADYGVLEDLMLGEAGIFAAKRLLECHFNRTHESPAEYYVSLCYFRKFYCLSRLGEKLISGDPIFTVHTKDVNFEIVLDEVSDLLVRPNIFEFAGMTVLEQYKTAHCLEDYLYATSLAVDLGLLDRAETGEFLGTHRFVHWAHASCTMTVDMFIDLVGKIELLCAAVVDSGYRSPLVSIPYQRRWLAYYVERLSSYWLIKAYEGIDAPVGLPHNVNIDSEPLGVFMPGGLR